MASRQVNDETPDVAKPNATYAGPTRPVGASSNPADELHGAGDGERAGATNEMATPASTKAREVDSNGVEKAEGARGRGAEDEVTRGEGAIVADSRGANGDYEVGHVYAQPTDT